MSTTPEELEATRQERFEDKKDKEVPEHARQEIAGETQKLVDDFKKLLDSLKAGGVSGITREFGKPLLIDETEATKAKDKSPSKIYRTGELPKIKSGITGELKKPQLAPGELQTENTRVEPGNQSVEPGNQSIEPRNQSIEPRNQSVEPGNQSIEPKNQSGEPGNLSVQPRNQHTKPRVQSVEPQNQSIEQPRVQSLEPRPQSVEPAPETRVDPQSRQERHDLPGQNSEARPAARRPDQVVRMQAEHIRVDADAVYRGEQINRDVAPGNHTVAGGETLETVARQHLGEGASQEEVQSHMREISRVNHLRNGRISEGQELVLPGHTRDGGYVRIDASGRTQTRWADGTERVESADGTGYVRRNREDGSYSEHHWGRQPQQNYELERSADGRYLVADRAGEPLREPADANDVRVAHARMNDLIETRIPNAAERARFQANMDAFERRAREQNLPPDEVRKTYEQIGRLLEHEGNRPLTENQRRAVAEQIMDQAANPRSIDQGYHSTCNVTTVESRLYTRNPSEAARLVTEVSTTGQFTARDGTVVRVPKDSLRPDAEAAHNPPEYGQRSHASQIFQVTALNMYYQTEPFTYTDERGRQRTVPPGGIRYEQARPVPGRANDTGERLVDTTRHPPRVIDRSPNITDDGIIRVNNRLTGERTNDIVISHQDDCYGDASRCATVANERELNDRIAQAAREGKLPIIVRVNSDNQPWLHDSGGGSAGGSGGAHVVSITGYEAGPPARVQVDNQWGEQHDRQGSNTLSVHDLYLSMRPADNRAQIAELQRDVDWDRAHNTIDTRKEFEILRLRHNLPADDPNHLNDADFDRMVGEQIDAAGTRWAEQRRNGTFNEAEERNARQSLSDLMRDQPPDRQLRWTERVHNAGIIDDARYDLVLSSVMRRNREKWADEDRRGQGNRAERQTARRELERILATLPEARRQAVIDNSRN